MSKKQNYQELKKIGKVFLYLGSSILIFKIAEWVGLDVKGFEEYIVAMINLGLAGLITSFKGEK